MSAHMKWLADYATDMDELNTRREYIPPKPDNGTPLERVNKDLRDWYEKTLAQSPWRRGTEKPEAPKYFPTSGDKRLAR